MFCKKCGKKLKIGEEFCSVCGYYNNNEEEGFLDEDYEKSYDDDFYDEIEEIDEEDYNKKEYDNEGHDKEEYDRDVSKGGIKVEENLINKINVEDSNEINEFSTSSNVKKPHKKMTNFKDDRLIEAFTGEDYKWIIRRPINIYALLLSWMYFIYRKMYIIGVAGLALTGIVYRFYHSFIIPYAIIVMVLSGFLFNPIYRLYAKFRISRIKEKNYGTDDFTLEQICAEKGGTNLILALVIFLIFIIVMFRTYYRLTYNNENTKFWTENSENSANCMNFAKSDYKILEDESVEGVLEEAVCNIRITNTTKSYDIYIKLKDNEKNSYKFVYFKDNKDSISIEGLNITLEELQTKNGNNTITEEEKAALSRLLEIKTEYTRIHEKSLEEDSLIKEKKNKTEKLNYIMKKDEILR